MTPNDPLAQAEREAREMLDCDAMCAHPEGDVERCAGRMCPQCVDRYKAAILARVRGIPEGMIQDISGVEWWIRREHQAADLKRYNEADTRNKVAREMLAALATLAETP